MKINSVINRYIFREMLPPSAITLLFFTFIFLLRQILEITNIIVNYKVGILTVLLLLIYSIPFFLVFVIPMSVMMSVLLTFLRMSGDNEIAALKSGGVNIWQLLPPVVIFCLLGCLLTGFMSIYGMPWGKLAFKTLTVEVAKSNIDIGLKERTFNNSFKGVMLYVNKIDLKNKKLIDVFIQDERKGDAMITVVAPAAVMTSDPENLVFRMRLFNGTINQVNPEQRSVNVINFETYDIALDLHQVAERVRSGPKDEREMSLAELRQYIREDTKKDAQYYAALIEFHKKFSIPFACISLGILAVPLGIQSKSARKSFALILGLFLFFFYYLMLSAGLVFGKAGVYPPVIGMWVPNIVTGAIGLYLLVRTVHGRPVYIDRITRLFKWLRK